MGQCVSTVRDEKSAPPTEGEGPSPGSSLVASTQHLSPKRPAESLEQHSHQVSLDAEIKPGILERATAAVAAAEQRKFRRNSSEGMKGWAPPVLNGAFRHSPIPPATPRGPFAAANSLRSASSVSEEAPAAASTGEAAPAAQGAARVSGGASAEAPLKPLSKLRLALQSAQTLPSDRDILPDAATLVSPSGVAPRHKSLDLTSLSSTGQGELVLGLQEELPDTTIDGILGLTQSIFRAKSVALHLVESDRLLVRGGSTLPPNLRYTTCHLLEGGGPLTVLEDTLTDGRVTEVPELSDHIRFFAAKELVAGNQFKLGYLCVFDSVPREFTAMNRLVLGNMADLLVRELWSAYEHAHRQNASQLVRVVDCYSEAMLFLELGPSSPWEVRHANEPALFSLGLDRGSMAGREFWELFTERGSVRRPVGELNALVQEEFTINSLVCTEGNSGTSYTAVFRPALLMTGSARHASAKEPEQPLVSAGRYFYFVGLSDNSQRVTTELELTPFEGLELRCLLGKGSYGRVYKGWWQGGDVAVKVVDAGAVRMKDGLPLEAVVTHNKAHPNVVRTITYAIASPDDLAESLSKEHMKSSCGEEEQPRAEPLEERQALDGSGEPIRTADLEDKEMWLVLEYCDAGTLLTAAKKGLLQPGEGRDLQPLLATAWEVASAMAHLHSHSVIHGDLTGGNVLLTSSARSAHGFTAKVADFGLARELALSSRVVTRTTGTLTHMPPELLQSGTVSKEGDVYAFGVILWECHEAKSAFSGLTPAQVMLEVGLKGKSLLLGPCACEGFTSLVSRCLARQRLDRPTFTEIVQDLRVLQGDKFLERRESFDAKERQFISRRSTSYPR